MFNITEVSVAALCPVSNIILQHQGRPYGKSGEKNKNNWKPKNMNLEGRLKEPGWTEGIRKVTEVRHDNLQICKRELHKRQSNVLHIHYKDEVIGLNSSKGDLT